MLEAKEKECTKCKQPKLIKEFGKRGQKLQPTCKTCVNKYQRERHKNKKKKKENEKLLQNSNTKDYPIFEKKPNMINQELNTLVRRRQEVLLPGEVYKFTKVSCPCGISVSLEYRYSYDSENDYYEGVCDICKRSFKQTITTKLP